MRTVSIGTMIEQLSGMCDTGDLTDWENDFVTSICDHYERAKKDTRRLSVKQVEIVQRIYGKHFA